jgi:hypothetical protein
MYNYIKKRDGRRVAFHTSKIMSAIERAGLETGEFAEAQAHKLAEKVVARAEKELFVKTPSVEQIQDIVDQINPLSVRDITNFFVLIAVDNVGFGGFFVKFQQIFLYVIKVTVQHFAFLLCEKAQLQFPLH